MNYVYTATIAFVAGFVVSKVYYARIIAALKSDVTRARLFATSELQKAKSKL